MPQEFRALITQARDTSGPALKQAEFTLRTYGECPWPPNSILANHVVVFSYLEFMDVLKRLVKALDNHGDEYNFSQDDDDTLNEAREILDRLTEKLV